MRSLRPGSALSFVGIVILCDPHIVVTSRRHCPREVVSGQRRGRAVRARDIDARVPRAG